MQHGKIIGVKVDFNKAWKGGIDTMGMHRKKKSQGMQRKRLKKLPSNAGLYYITTDSEKKSMEIMPFRGNKIMLNGINEIRLFCNAIQDSLQELNKP